MSTEFSKVPFVSVSHMTRLVMETGIDRFLLDLAATIEGHRSRV